jgi:hypothetical protein
MGIEYGPHVFYTVAFNRTLAARKGYLFLVSFSTLSRETILKMPAISELARRKPGEGKAGDFTPFLVNINTFIRNRITGYYPVLK